jgi:hypothetical protein
VYADIERAAAAASSVLSGGSGATSPSSSYTSRTNASCTFDEQLRSRNSRAHSRTRARTRTLEQALSASRKA